jgi:hypothetical protein
MTGRPTKLTEKTSAQIVALVRAGNFLTTAAHAAGIARSVLYDWLARGEAEQPAPGDEAFVAFAVALRTAEAQAEAEAVASVRRASKGHKGRAFWLERRFPDRWGRRLRAELSGPDGGPMQHNVTGVVVMPAWGASDGQPLPEPK